MNDEQRFAFDTWGFLTIEDALTPEQVAALKATVDEKGPDLHSQHSDRGGFWSQEFVDLLDVPVIAAILEEIYGGPRDDGEPPFHPRYVQQGPRRGHHPRQQRAAVAPRAAARADHALLRARSPDRTIQQRVGDGGV